MRNSYRFFVAAAIVLAFGVQAFSAQAASPTVNTNDWRYIHSVEVKKVGPTQTLNQSVPLSYNDNCTTQAVVNPANLINLSQIINLGAKVWAFIEDNKPVVSAQTLSANALPTGVACWYRLANWQPPRSDTYSVVYKNGFGFTVVHLVYSVIYSYGGNYQGLGHYLMNSTVQYKELSVAWGGFKVNANVDVPTVTNIGTTQNPIAGMQVNVHWVVTGLNRIERTASYFIAGDGRPTQLL